MDMPNALRIVLLGKNGVGKSSLANLLFADHTFKINNLSDLETHSTTVRTKAVGGRSVSLIDTPGFFDPCRSEEAMLPEMLRCSAECAPGPHAFLIVFKVEKFIEHNKDVVSKMRQYFPKNALKYGVIVFTHGDQLPEEMTLERYIEESGDLGDLVKECGGRCHVVDSKYWTGDDAPRDRSNRIHVAALLSTVERLVAENKGGFYSDGKIREIGEQLQKEEELLRATSGGSMSQGEIRERAMSIVVKKQVDAKARVWGWGLAKYAFIAGLFAFISAILIRFKMWEDVKERILPFHE
ncbi:GTPase IMAP family member 7-like [Pseudoliparis swirei]|uniref:GTPase IMAP family member 7-like n=1 Tax=Pseudoliparis swirei TaxID=2059687 RepID=UPI0024BDE31B|nr:GTPase IMAP family member 7-like [Pseudoliparis swirei]